MPLVSVEQFLRDDGKLEIRVHNCSGAKPGVNAVDDYPLPDANSTKEDLVFQSGSQDTEQPCAVIFSLRSSHPYHFYYRGAAESVPQSGARTYLSPAVASITPDGERASIVAASEREWGTHGFSSVASASLSPALHTPAYPNEDINTARSLNNSMVFPGRHADSSSVPSAAAVDRPLLVREAVPDGVLLPGERCTLVLDLDDPQYLKDYFKQRIAIREKEALLTHHHNANNSSGSNTSSSPNKRQTSQTYLSQRQGGEDDAPFRTPKKRRVTAMPGGASTPPPQSQSQYMPAHLDTAEAGSDARSSSFGPGLMRDTTAAFPIDSTSSSHGTPANLRPNPPQVPLGSDGLLDSRAPPQRRVAAPLDSSSEDEDDEDELTSSAVPYSRMTIHADSEPRTSPVLASQRGRPHQGPSAANMSLENDRSPRDTSRVARRGQGITVGFSDTPDAPMYPVEDPPPPTISSRLNGKTDSSAVLPRAESASLDWSGSLNDTTSPSSSTTRLSRGRGSLMSSGTAARGGAGGDGAAPPTARSPDTQTAATRTPPPMLYVYYSRLGDENKCVERARKWLKREEKNYVAWQDTLIKSIVKLEKRRQPGLARGVAGDSSRSMTRSTSTNTFGGGSTGAVITATTTSPSNTYTRLLPPALGDPIRWRRNTHAANDHLTASDFSNVSIVRSRAAFSRFYGKILQDEVGVAKVAAAITDRVIPFAATRTNSVSKEAQKLFKTDRVGDGVVVQPLRWQLFVPRQPHHRQPLMTPRAAGADAQLTSPSSTIWRGDISQSSTQSQAATWMRQSDDISARATPEEDSGAAPAGRGTVAATVPRPASVNASSNNGGSDRRPSPRGEANSRGPLSYGEPVRAGRGLALLDDSVTASRVFDLADLAADSPSDSRVPPLVDPRYRSSHSRDPSNNSTPPPQFDATRSFLPPVGVERTKTLDPNTAAVLGMPRQLMDRSDSMFSDPSTHSDVIGSPLIAFSNAAKPAKDNTLWGSLMSTGSRGAVSSPRGVEDLHGPGSTPPLHATTSPLSSSGIGLGGALPTANLESSLRSQGAPLGLSESGIVNASFSRLNTYLKSYLHQHEKSNSGERSVAQSQSDLYPTEDGMESQPFLSAAAGGPQGTESSGVMSPLEESTFGLSSQTGMRPLTTAPPASLLKRASPVTPAVSLSPTPGRGQVYLENRAMQGGALGTIALTLSLIAQLVVVFVCRLHDLIAPFAGQLMTILAEQTPSLVSAVWNFFVDVVLADENVKVLQQVMVPALGLMGVWLVVATVLSSGGSPLVESDFDGPL